MRSAALLLGVFICTNVLADGPKVGDRAPSWQLPGSDGQVHTLEALRGQHVVLAWFPKAFTGG